jgi:sugar/nucleoside kinase (ribokinase family)
MKIIGMGNALVDIMTLMDNDSILKKYNLPNGSMTLVDRELSNAIYIETSGLHKRMSSGGSAANTIHGLAHLGVKTAFIGKIGKDEMGSFFKNDMDRIGIKPLLFNSINDTGKVIALIGQDSERTFATFLGAASELSPDDIVLEIFKGYQCFYAEGYLVQNYKLIEKSFRLAKASGLKTCVDLASYNVVESHKEFLRNLLKQYVDIVFANEDEAKALTGKTPEGAIQELSELCAVAIIKTGNKGSVIQSGQNLVKINSLPVKLKDTTGAGDLYASGFLYGMSKNYDLKLSGEIGTYLASKVIETIGAKMDEPTWDLIRKGIENIVV